MIHGVSIGLTGHMRSGKDEVGKILVEKYGFNRFGFGDGIVETCKKLFPHEFEQGIKPRRLLQEFGQEQVRRHENVWVDYTFSQILSQEIDPVVDNVVITDLRQPHEYKALVESGFVIVRVNADEFVRKERMRARDELVTDEIMSHETESHISNYEVDYEIDNNGTPDQLIEQVEIVLRDITGGELF